MKCKHKLSPTSINIYRKCPRQYYFYREKYPSLPPVSEEALVFGDLVHKIIARYYQIIPDDIVPGDVRIWVKKAMTDLWSEKYEPFRERVENQLLNFANFEEKRLGWHINPRPIAVEKVFEKNCVKGIVDALFRKNGKTIIVDWKTGKGQADLNDDIIIQLSTYMWLTGASEAYVLFLEYGNFRKLNRVVDIQPIVNTILNDNKYTPVRGEHCNYCVFSVACEFFGKHEQLLKQSMWWAEVV